MYTCRLIQAHIKSALSEINGTNASRYFQSLYMMLGRITTLLLNSLSAILASRRATLLQQRVKEETMEAVEALQLMERKRMKKAMKKTLKVRKKRCS